VARETVYETSGARILLAHDPTPEAAAEGVQQERSFLVEEGNKTYGKCDRTSALRHNCELADGSKPSCRPAGIPKRLEDDSTT
jgi:hypothetical protein